MSNTKTYDRIKKICTRLILRYPFYGYLMMHMDIKETEHEKAYTDMKSMFFNYSFIEGLNDYELEFVVLHEILHAALKHPINIQGHDPAVYSVAADIMVNSIILDSIKATKVQIGPQLITKSIFGNDVYQMGTEKIYDRLMSERKSRYVKEMLFKESLDNHQCWKSESLIGNMEYLNGLWERNIKEALEFENEHGGYGINGTAMFVSEFICKKSDYVSKTDWKKVLRDFLTISNEKSDYTFTPPDKRFNEGDIFIPDYNLTDDSRIGRIWFCVDTSMSMQRADIEALYVEIEKCIHDLGSLDGLLSFFDEGTTEPVNFHTVKDIYNIKPSGGGGTDFQCIFEYMHAKMMSNLPAAIIVMTDGYASFPKEKMACGIPILWAIIGGDSVVPPWGKTIYI